MKKLLLIFPLLFLFCDRMYAQIFDGTPAGITSINFNVDTLFNSGISVDTTGMGDWQFGNTSKPFFSSNGNSVHAIMTDTLLPYRTNMNNSFLLKFNYSTFNVIIDFWHRYQTDSTNDGGLVEISNDSVNWKNVTGACTTNGTFDPGIKTYNFYTLDDTLKTGEAAFTGTSNGSQYSRFQIFITLPDKLTDNSCNFNTNPIWVRFRFISDSVADNLDGWIIDSIKIESDSYGGSVKTIKKPELNVYPNPSTEGIYYFPALNDEKNYQIEVYDLLGSRIEKMPYTHLVNLSKYPSGNYFYRVSDGQAYYTGQLIKD